VKTRTPLPAAFSDPGEPRRRRNGLTIRAYLGTCVICRCGCYEGDEVTRGCGQLLGILHEACAKAAESHGEPRLPLGPIPTKGTIRNDHGG
jgi:hypothetical protein